MGGHLIVVGNSMVRPDSREENPRRGETTILSEKCGERKYQVGGRKWGSQGSTRSVKK